MRIFLFDIVANPKKPGIGRLSDLNWRLVKEITDHGEDVSIFGIYEAGVKVPYDNIQYHPHTSLAQLRQNDLTHVWKIYQVLKRAKALADEKTIFHVTDTVTAGIASAIGLGNRVIWQGHLNVYHHSQLFVPWERSTYILLRLCTWLAAHRARFVVALGPSLVPWWQRAGFPQKHIAVIPNGIDEMYVINSDEEMPVQWLDKRYKLLYIGRLGKDKGGYTEMLKAVQTIKQTGLGVGLLIIGDGDQKAMIQDRVQQLNLTQEVFLAGARGKDFVIKAAQSADLVLLPSYNEMMPRVMLEAWVYGVPIMTTRVGAIPDHIIDQHNGFLLDSLENEYFARYIRQVLENEQLRSSVIKQAKDNLKNYAWDVIAKQYIALYSTILNEN